MDCYLGDFQEKSKLTNTILKVQQYQTEYYSTTEIA